MSSNNGHEPTLPPAATTDHDSVDLVSGLPQFDPEQAFAFERVGREGLVLDSPDGVRLNNVLGLEGYYGQDYRAEGTLRRALARLLNGEVSGHLLFETSLNLTEWQMRTFRKGRREEALGEQAASMAATPPTLSDIAPGLNGYVESARNNLWVHIPGDAAPQGIYAMARLRGLGVRNVAGKPAPEVVQLVSGKDEQVGRQVGRTVLYAEVNHEPTRAGFGYY